MLFGGASSLFLTAMDHKLYETFLENPEVYRACERYWEDMISKIANDLGQSGQWVPWESRQWVDGSPMPLDGNPILHAQNKRLGRGFKIIQDRESDGQLDIAAWLKINEEEYEDIVPRYELIISLSLSDQSEQMAQELLRKWMAPETTPADIEHYIARHIKPHYRHQSQT